MIPEQSIGSSSRSSSTGTTDVARVYGALVGIAQTTAATSHGISGVSTAPCEQDMPVLHPQVPRLLAHRHCIIFTWLLLTAISIPFAPSIFDKLNFEASPLRGTGLQHAAEGFERDFPGLVHSTPLIIMFYCDSKCVSSVNPFAAKAMRQMAGLFQELNNTFPGMIMRWESAADVDALRSVARLEGSTQLSEDKQTLSSISHWMLPEFAQDKVLTAVRQVRALAAELDAEGELVGMSVSVQGLPALKDAFKEETERDIFRKDLLTVPFAIGVFLYQVRSWRLALLCTSSMLACITIGFAILLLVVDSGIHVNTMTPAMMVVMCIAMSVDYCLFVLARFREEVQGGRNVEFAISIALTQGGRIVALSGTILICCYAACLLFPGDMIFTLALGTLWILLLCVLSSLTLVPCAIVSFPEFFSKGLTIDQESGPQDAVGSFGTHGNVPKAWFRLGVWITRWPFPIVIPLLIYTCMVPAVSRLIGAHITNDIRTTIPGGSVLKDFVHLQTAFPGAGAFPVFLRVEAATNTGVMSNDFFDDACATIRQLINVTSGTHYQLLPRDFQSVVIAPDRITKLLPIGCSGLICLRWSTGTPSCLGMPSAQALLENAGSSSSSPVIKASKAYRKVWENLVSADRTSSVAVINPSFQPKGGVKRSVMNAIRSVAPTDMVYSHDAIDFDMIKADYSRLPLVMLLTLVVMFVLIGWSFGAALVPLKLLLTVVAPVAFVFGIVFEAYQHGSLDRFHIPHVNSNYGLHWTVPILAGPILTGLAVDYDLFLFARVYELRNRGFDNRSAVIGALFLSGPVISGAGLVMGLAFGGMMLSNIRLNSEIGFALAIGVIVDAFIVRPILVPCVLVLGGGLNYWPKKMPDVCKSLDELEDICFGNGLEQKPLWPEKHYGSIDSVGTPAGHLLSEAVRWPPYKQCVP